MVVDSSAWLEVAIRGPRAKEFRRRMEGADGLLVPSIVLYEVYKVLLRECSEHIANQVATQLKSHRLVPLDDRLTMEAAELSLRHGLPLADAVVYATALAHGARLLTADYHFSALPGVEYVARPE